MDIGHYKALEWNENEQKYMDNPDLGILVEVDVCHCIQSIRQLFLKDTAYFIVLGT